MDPSTDLRMLDSCIQKFKCKKKHDMTHDDIFDVLAAFLGQIIFDELTMFGSDARVRAVIRACASASFTDDDRILAEAIAQSKSAAFVRPLLSSLFDRLAPLPQSKPRDDGLGSGRKGVCGEKDDPIAESLFRAWENRYYGSPLHDLTTFVDTYNSLDEKDIYAKTVVFVQSSGMGKSRLADEYGRTICPMIGYCLRRESGGFPDADEDIVQFVLEDMSAAQRIMATSSPLSADSSTNLPSPTEPLPSSKLSTSTSLPLQETSSSAGVSSGATPVVDRPVSATGPPGKPLLAVVTEQPRASEPLTDKKPTRQDQADDRQTEQNQDEERLANKLETEKRLAKATLRADLAWNHAVAVSLLQASFEKFAEWVRTLKRKSFTLEELAHAAHGWIGATRANIRFPTNAASRSRASLVVTSRSKFCRNVSERAAVIRTTMMQRSSWRSTFNDSEASSAIRHRLESNNELSELHRSAVALSDAIESRLVDFVDPRRPLLTVQFDEASCFLVERRNADTNDGDGAEEEPSAARSIKMLVPPDSNETTGSPSELSSVRVALPGKVEDRKLFRFPPFIYFCIDIAVRGAVREHNSRRSELRKSLAQIARPAHLAMYGRPLWHGYNTDDLHDFARLKLLGGATATFAPASNIHHLFAVLSARLALDVCMQNPRTMALVDRAVGSYLRVVDGIDAASGVMSTHAPSEPILAQAALECLCDGNNWNQSVIGATAELVEKGFVERGLKGELYARLLCCVANDALYRQALRAAAKTNAPPHTASYSLRSFLLSLYGKEHASYIDVMDAKLLSTRLNFTHFAVTEEHLAPNVLPALLRDLLRCRAALQLCFQQRYVDLLIPGYQGSEDEELNPDKCVYFGIQVKNKAAATLPRTVLEVDFHDIAPPDQAPIALKSSHSEEHASSQEKDAEGVVQCMEGLSLRATHESDDGEIPSSAPTPAATTADAAARRTASMKGFASSIGQPALFILFDLGVEAGPRTLPVQLQQTAANDRTAPGLWAIHSRGHSWEVFACIDDLDMKDSALAFWAAMTGNGKLPPGLVNDPKKMMRFRQLGERYRHDIL